MTRHTPCDKFAAALVDLRVQCAVDVDALPPGSAGVADVGSWEQGQEFPDLEELLLYGWHQLRAPIAGMSLVVRLHDDCATYRWLHHRPGQIDIDEEPEPDIGPRVRESDKTIRQREWERAVKQHAEGPLWRHAGAGVFISYRRSDEPHLAGRLHDRLQADLPGSTVFLDVAVPSATDFVEAIDLALDRSHVVVVVIGEHWQPPHPDDPEDFVRLEVAGGLSRGLHVLPVLVDKNAEMPAESELCPDMSALARKNATRILHDSFEIGYQALRSAIERLLTKNG